MYYIICIILYVLYYNRRSFPSVYISKIAKNPDAAGGGLFCKKKTRKNFLFLEKNMMERISSSKFEMIAFFY